MNQDPNSAKPGRCAKCGACTAVCPVYQATGRESLTARGKLHLLERLPPGAASPAYAGILSQCLLCGACTAVCPNRVNVPERLILARAAAGRLPGSHAFKKQLACALLARPELLSRAASFSASAFELLKHRLPPESGLRIKLGILAAEADLLVPAPESTGSAAGAGLSYFSGCLAAHVDREIAVATMRLARLATGTPPAVPTGQVCCGQAAYSCGDLSQAQALAKKNIAAFANGAAPILTSCASCYRHLLTYPDLLSGEPEWLERAAAFASRVVELSTFFQERLPAAESNGQRSVLYHDPCHFRFGLTITEPPRRLLREKAGLELIELPHGPGCCGQGGLFRLAHPAPSRAILEKLLDDFHGLAVEEVATTCSGCLLQWREGLALAGSRARARHLAVILDERLAGRCS